MCIPVYSPWLPGYINVTETVLIILTTVGLFLDRPHIAVPFLFFYVSHFGELPKDGSGWKTAWHFLFVQTDIYGRETDAQRSTE